MPASARRRPAEIGARHHHQVEGCPSVPSNGLRGPSCRTATRESRSDASSSKASAPTSSSAGSSVQTITVSTSCLSSSASAATSSPTSSTRRGRCVRPSTGTWTSISPQGRVLLDRLQDAIRGESAEPGVLEDLDVSGEPSAAPRRTHAMSKTIVNPRFSLRSCHHAASGGGALTVSLQPGRPPSPAPRSRERRAARTFVTSPPRRRRLRMVGGAVFLARGPGVDGSPCRRPRRVHRPVARREAMACGCRLARSVAGARRGRTARARRPLERLALRAGPGSGPRRAHRLPHQGRRLPGHAGVCSAG